MAHRRNSLYTRIHPKWNTISYTNTKEKVECKQWKHTFLQQSHWFINVLLLLYQRIDTRIIFAVYDTPAALNSYHTFYRDVFQFLRSKMDGAVELEFFQETDIIYIYFTFYPHKHSGHVLILERKGLSFMRALVKKRFSSPDLALEIFAFEWYTRNIRNEIDRVVLVRANSLILQQDSCATTRRMRTSLCFYLFNVYFHQPVTNSANPPGPLSTVPFPFAFDPNKMATN